jgi:hypothetical protein
MSLERRDNDQAVEETKREAAQIERKASSFTCGTCKQLKLDGFSY